MVLGGVRIQEATTAAATTTSISKGAGFPIITTNSADKPETVVDEVQKQFQT